MNSFCTEMAELARAMRDFLHAVDVRSNLTINDAMAMLDAWHGPDAALVAMSHAEAAQADDDPIDAAFWIDVYHALLKSMDAGWSRITFH